MHLPVATADSGRLIRAGPPQPCLHLETGGRYKKAGVVCLDLHPAASVQVGLFHAPDTPVRQELMASLDALNRRYGRGTVAYEAAGTRQGWALRSDQRSPAYTTQWDYILIV